MCWQTNAFMRSEQINQLLSYKFQSLQKFYKSFDKSLKNSI
jgi:hypothetical protein